MAEPAPAGRPADRAMRSYLLARKCIGFPATLTPRRLSPLSSQHGGLRLVPVRLAN